MLVGTLFFSAAEKSLARIPLPLHLSPTNQSQTGEAVITGDVVRFCILNVCAIDGGLHQRFKIVFA